MYYQNLKNKISLRTARIGVIGLGYVGLPLALEYAKKGFEVTGIDIDSTKVKKLKRGESYILDVSSPELKKVVLAKRLKATTDYSELAALDAVIICVPTPLSKTKEPDISYVVDATRNVAKYLKKGRIVVLESTTYPGTTEEVMLPMLEKVGVKAEKDLFLCFSPERVDPGNKNFDTATIPKVVGGVGPKSSELGQLLYGQIVTKVVTVSSARAAEMTKLLENTFRSVNIGLINEMALMCGKMNMDIWEIIDAAKTKPFGFMPFYPGPGLGGHCLPIDPLYLSWKSRLHGFEARMIELASSINEAMPVYVVERITHFLNQRKKALKKSSILLLGVAYKKDIDDLRESPALEVMDHLLKEGARVIFHDPFVSQLKLGGKTYQSQKLSAKLCTSQDCVVVLTDHSKVDYALVVKNSKLIFDTRNALKQFKSKSNIQSL